jgi:hypothetical protein
MALCIFPIWFIGEGPLLAEDCLLPEFYESPLTRKLTLRLDYSAAIYDCDFNRSMQHLISTYREEDVENENATEDLLHRN